MCTSREIYRYIGAALIFLGVFILPFTPVNAEQSIGLEIRVTLIQCGERAEMRDACEVETRCCVFLDELDDYETIEISEDNTESEYFSAPSDNEAWE